MFKDLSISKKIYFPVIFSVIISIVVILLISKSSIKKMSKEIREKAAIELSQSFNAKMKEKENIGVTNAINLANNLYIIEALKNNDRNLAISGLKNINSQLKNETKFKNVKIHIHTKDIHSFLRDWAPNKFGDNLSSFRKTIVSVKNNNHLLSAIEIGRAGLVLRGISPIRDNGEYLGSVEFMQGLNSINKDLLKMNIYSVIVMDKKYLNIATSFRNKPSIMKNFVLVTKDDSYDKNFEKELESVSYFRDRFETKNF